MSTLDPRPTPEPLSSLDPEGLRAGLLTALAVPRFVDDVVARAPFPHLAALLEAAAVAADPLSRAEIDQALAHHPRIGERPEGTGVSAELSRREQSSADAADESLAILLAEGNRAYEEKFDRVFLIRAAGRSRAEILGELDRRLRLDDADDLRIVGEQLTEIALLRLTTLFGPGDAVAGAGAGADADPGTDPNGRAR